MPSREESFSHTSGVNITHGVVHAKIPVIVTDAQTGLHSIDSDLLCSTSSKLRRYKIHSFTVSPVEILEDSISEWIVVMFVAPLVALGLIAAGYRQAGGVVLAVSMAVALVFSIVFHYVLSTPDQSLRYQQIRVKDHSGSPQRFSCS